MRHDDTTVALEAAHIKWETARRPCEIPMVWRFAIHHKAFDKGSIGPDENMRVLVSDAVNGGGSLRDYSGILTGKLLRCRRCVKITLMRVCKVASERGFGGEVDNYRSMFNIADIISAGSCR